MNNQQVVLAKLP